MRSWIALSALVLACARERPPAPPPKPERAPPMPAPAREGRLIVRHFSVGVAVCAPTHPCAPVASLPANVTAVVQNGAKRYLFATATATYEWDVATGAVEERVGGGPDVTSRLEDGSFIRYEHLSSRSRVFRRAPGENWVAMLEYEKWRAYEFRFLPDGRHLFKHSPGMGGPESPYFTDMLVGHPTHLMIADAPGQKPREVHVSSQQMDAEFLDGGRRIGWWQPGGVDPATGRRWLTLEVLELANKSVRSIARVETPIALPSGALHRSAPATSSSLRSTWIVHAHEHDAAFRARSLRAEDVATGQHFDLQLAPLERMLDALPHDSVYVRRHARRGSDHIVLARSAANPLVTELSVVAIPSFETIYRTSVPTQGLVAADWVELP